MATPIRLEIPQNCAQFLGGVVVVLRDCELEALFKPGLRFRFSVETEEGFPEENARHHPLRFFRGAGNQMFERIGRLVFRQQGLGETETKKLVVRLAGNKRSKVS